MISTIVKQIFSEYRINTSLGANPDNVPEFFWMDDAVMKFPLSFYIFLDNFFIISNNYLKYRNVSKKPVGILEVP